MGILEYLYVYLLGGITFIPILVVLFIYCHPQIKSEDIQKEKLKAGEIEEKNQTGLETYKSGWVIVTQDYLESKDEINSSTQSISDSTENKSAYTSLYKLIQKENVPTNPEQTELLTKPATEKIKSSQKKHRFFAILKHGNLFLYKNEKLTDVKHVVVLSNEVITIWPPGLPDGQLFTKSSAICIMKKNWSRARRLSDNFSGDKISTLDILNRENDLEPPKGSIFIYCDTNYDKEDWYFALIRSTKTDNEEHPLNPNVHAKTSHFETSSMIDLIQTLYSSEGHIQTKWYNAIAGRLFLSLQHTDLLHNFLKKKIAKKLDKIKKPGFLDTFQITRVHPGNSTPFITYPNLKEINPDGTLVISAYIHYHGDLSLQIATKVNINLGSRFKPREVDVLLSITLERMEGPILFKIKPPPSERIWYTFETMPILNLKIEPVISSRQLGYNIITNQIEKKFKEAIKDSLVLPHWDDIVFYDTTNDIYRGGIWEKASSMEESEITVEEEATDVAHSEAAVNLNEEKSELSDISPPEEANNLVDLKKLSFSTKNKFNSTLNDLSKRLKKQKSTHTLGISEENCLSDGSIMGSNMNTEQELTTGDLNKKSTINTIKKIGKWYFKDGKMQEDQVVETYTPPDMISNRRSPRKSSVGQNASMYHSAGQISSQKPLYEFAKYSEDPLVNFNIEKKRPQSRSISYGSLDSSSSSKNHISSKLDENYEDSIFETSTNDYDENVENNADSLLSGNSSDIETATNSSNIIGKSIKRAPGRKAPPDLSSTDLLQNELVANVEEIFKSD